MWHRFSETTSKPNQWAAEKSRLSVSHGGNVSSTIVFEEE